MSKQYKIFAAMARLGSFTVQELADEVSSKVATVRTAINRASDWLEPVTVMTGRPGGQGRRYRLLDRGRKAIEKELDGIVTAQKTRLPLSLDEELNDPASPLVPLGLLVAESILSERIHVVSDDVKLALFDQVRDNLDWAEKEVAIEPQFSNNANRAQLAAARALLRELSEPEPASHQVPLSIGGDVTPMLALSVPIASTETDDGWWVSGQPSVYLVAIVNSRIGEKVVRTTSVGAPRTRTVAQGRPRVRAVDYA